jgi:hypothetical protein
VERADRGEAMNRHPRAFDVGAWVSGVDRPWRRWMTPSTSLRGMKVERQVAVSSRCTTAPVAAVPAIPGTDRSVPGDALDSASAG